MKADEPISQREFLTNRYQELWVGAIGLLREGQVTVDPLLARREPDQRRSLTVLARPSTEVQENVATFLDQLRRLEPDQYYYDPSEFHVTVLSLFTGTLDYSRLLARYDDYLEAVNAALSGARSFAIEFTGITLSRETIMIQGFPETSVLNDVRESLRRELRARKLTEGLEVRYVLQTAHMTVARYRSPLRNSQSFAEFLEQCRGRTFGRTDVQELHLVRNDWFVSRASVQIILRYQLL